MAADLLLFTLSESREFGERVAQALGVPLSPHEERDFEDGEHKTRPLCNVRGRDVFVLQSLYGEPQRSVNDKLCRLLFFLGALRDASAARVTAVVPYLCYARKDRKSKSRDPVTTRYVAGLFEAVGTSRVLTMDVHNLAAFQNAFRIPTDHLEAQRLFVEYCAGEFRDEPLVVMSPDVGGVKRAKLFEESLSRALGRPVETAFMEKQRSAGVVSGETLVGNVADRTVVLIDDLISSGTTLARAAAACRNHGARRIQALATHGVFTQAAEQILAESPLERIVVTNTVPPFRISERFLRERMRLLDAAPLHAEAIRRVHEGGSIVDLLEG